FIVSVNEAWRRFAVANAFADVNYGVGENYISLCEHARGECSEEAGAVAVGIRNVLRGEAADFGLEYPCHSPDVKRWFRIMVTPLHEGKPGGAVVMHINVTERKLAE